MSRISVDELSEELRRAISGLKDEKGLDRAGIVTRVGDGIVWIYGLREAGYNEILKIETVDGKTIESFALNLMEDEIGAVFIELLWSSCPAACCRMIMLIPDLPVLYTIIETICPSLVVVHDDVLTDLSPLLEILWRMYMVGVICIFNGLTKTIIHL